MRRGMIISKKIRNKTGFRCGSRFDVLSGSSALSDIICWFWRSWVSCVRRKMDTLLWWILCYLIILTLRTPVGVFFQFCAILNYFFKPRINSETCCILLLTGPPSKKFKISFSVKSPPINEISLFKIMKQKGSLNLVVIGWGMVLESLIVFCLDCI